MLTEMKLREVPLEDVKQGPVRHPEGRQADATPVVVGNATDEDDEDEEDVDDLDEDEEDDELDEDEEDDDAEGEVEDEDE